MHGCDKMHVEKMKKLSTCFDEKIAENEVIHEVMNIIHMNKSQVIDRIGDKNKQLFCSQIIKYIHCKQIVFLLY